MTSRVHNGNWTNGGWIDLLFNETRNVRKQNLSSAPTVPAPVQGQEYYDTTLLKYGVFNGTTWDYMGVASGTVTGPGSTVDSEVVLFSGTTGSIVKRATGSGLAKLVSGVLGVAAAGSDYYNPGGTDVAITDGGTGVSTLPTGLLKGAGTGAITAATAGVEYLAPAGDGGALTGITEAQVAGLTNDLNLKAPLLNPALTGAPTAPTPTAGTNTSQIASTAFVQTAVGAVIAAADALVFKGGIDASTNPNYPAADAGWVYRITVAGKIGGASGTNVDVGDTITCAVDATAAGTQAAVGANWIITQTNLEAATTSLSGFVSLATNAEALARSVTTKAVTPVALVGYAQKYSVDFGNATLTTFTITHNLNTLAVSVSIYLKSSGALESCEVVAATANTVTLSGWVTAPASNAYLCVVMG